MIFALLDASNALAPTSSTLPTAAGVAIVSGMILDYAKRLQKIPKISYYTTKLNNLIRLAMSGVGTLGVSWVWSAAGTGHQLLITIPAWSVIGLGLWHWAIQYGGQYGFEQILQLRPLPPSAGPKLDEVVPAPAPAPAPVPVPVNHAPDPWGK